VVSSKDVGEVTGDQSVAATPAPAPPSAPVRRVGAGGAAPGATAPPAATVTAEIPVVAGDGQGRRRRPQRGTDEWYATRRRPAPYVVRLTVWLLFFVLVLVLAGRGVEHYHPAWLDFLRNTTGAHPPSRGSSAAGASTATTGAPRPTGTVPSGFRLVSSSAHGATYSVPSRAYSVVVTTTAPSWTAIAVPAGSSTYRYAETVAPGASPKSFAVVGSSTVVVDHTVTSIGVKIGGTTVGTITAPKVGYPYSFRPTAS